MTEQITLPPFLRQLLLTEICKRMNIIDYCTRQFYIPFNRDIGNNWTAAYCPYCHKKNVFMVSRTTGKCFCPVCKKETDFFDLMNRKKGWDAPETLHFLSEYLEQAEQRSKYKGGVI